MTRSQDLWQVCARRRRRAPGAPLRLLVYLCLSLPLAPGAAQACRRTPLRVMSVGLASPRQSLRQSVASFLPAAAVASGRQCFFSIACQWCCGCICFPHPPATPRSIPTNTARVLTACTNGRRVPPVSRSARAIAHPFAPRAALYGRPIASGSEAIGGPIVKGPQAIGGPIVKGPQAIGGPIGRSSPCSMRAR